MMQAWLDRPQGAETGVGVARAQQAPCQRALDALDNDQDRGGFTGVAEVDGAFRDGAPRAPRAVGARRLGAGPGVELDRLQRDDDSGRVGDDGKKACPRPCVGMAAIVGGVEQRPRPRAAQPTMLEQVALTEGARYRDRCSDLLPHPGDSLLSLLSEGIGRLRPVLLFGGTPAHLHIGGAMQWRKRMGESHHRSPSIAAIRRAASPWRSPNR